jgi:hypothetical protein
LRDSLDEEERGADQPPSYDPAQRSTNNIARDVSPLPAPQAQKPIVPPRESLDGDTIFAVGEDDKWSSEESDDEEEESDEESDDSDDSDESGPSNSKAKDSERSRLTGRKND